MRNKGLHRGAEFIRQTKETLLRPNDEAILKLYEAIGGLRQQEADMWKLRGNPNLDVRVRAKLEADQAELTGRIQALMAELERKQVLKRVFEHLIAHRATEVVQEYRELKPEFALSHGEHLTLAEIERFAYA